MTEPYKPYCITCRTKREMADPQSIIMKTGKPALRGHCSVCKTPLFVIGANIVGA